MSKFRYASLAAVVLVIGGLAEAQAQRPRQQQPPPQTQPLPQPSPSEVTPIPAPPPPSPPPAAPPPAAAPAAQPAAPQGPVPVVVVAAQKSAAELAAEQKERDERAAFSTRLLILASVLVAVGLLQFAAFGIQAFYILLAMRALNRSTRVAERNMTQSQRAFVFVGALPWSVTADGVTIVPLWENNGATPARSLRISTNWKTLHGDLPADFPYSYVRAPDRVFLGPRAKCEVGAVTIPMRDAQAAIERRLQLYVWGRATYEDIFEGTEPHFVEFCHRVEASGSAPNAIALTFVPYGPYNRADGDSMRPDV